MQHQSQVAQHRGVAKLLGTPSLSEGSTLDFMFGFISDGWRSLRLFGRRLRVYAVAWYARRQYQNAEEQAKTAGLTEEEIARIWDDTHAYVAGLVCSQMLALEGLWVKLGQYMSTRADILPDVWVTHLLQLQDDVPAKPFSEVHATLMEELSGTPRRRNFCSCGRKEDGKALAHPNMMQLFERFDEKPLGTASIAQVHRAWLAGGEAVVVKVQHRGVEDIILQDLDNAAYLVEELVKSKPEYDFRAILSEWSAETKKELDFIHEADNTERVAANLQNLTGVKVPRVIRNTRGGFVLEPTRRVLILEYMDGVKPNDTKVLSSWGVRGEHVMERLSAAFAQQIFIDGLFNGDPHPGNMLIERGTGTPVLLDFGLVKELPTETRVAFCRLVLAAAENDFTGLLQALKEMGLSKHVSLSRPEEAMEAVRFMFRDAAPDAKQRRSGVTYTAVHKLSDEPDDSDDFLPHPFGGSLPTFPSALQRAATTRELINSSHRGKDVKSSDASSVAAASRRSEVTGKRYPVEATPGTVIFLLRVVSCLRGIAVSLGCQHSYLKAFAPYARKALRASLSSHQLLQPVAPQNSLEAALLAVAQRLCKSGDALGLQVCVFRHGKKEADIACGEMGPLDPRPMQHDALISAFSCGKGLAVLLVHVLADRGLLASLDDPVCRYWPAFGSAGKASITVRQMLEHKAGLAHVMPDFSSADGAGSVVREFCNFDKMQRWIAKAKPNQAEIGHPTYHAMTHGWLVAGFAEKVAQAHDKRWTYESLVHVLILQPLGIANNVAVRIAEEGDSFICGGLVLEKRLASIGISAKMLSQDGSGDILGDMNNDSSTLQEMGMDPRAFNDASLRASLLPQVNTHWTATGLATMYAALANDGALPGQGRVLSAAYCCRLQEEIAACKEEGLWWPSGFRRFKVASSASNPVSVPRGFGFPGLFNNMAYCDPAEGLSVAILVNQLDTQGTAAKALLGTVAQALGVAKHTGDGLGVH